MSIKVMNWVWEHSQAAGTELLMLLAIADHADDDGRNAWPSRARLAAKTRLDERTVRRVIKRLEKAGLLRIVRGHGRTNSNRYTVVTDAATESEKGAERPEAERHAGNSPCGAVPSEKGAFDPEKGVTAPPEPSITIQEPSKRDIAPSPTDDFDAFWASYPRRKARQAARTAWDRALKAGAEPSALVAAAQRYAAQRAGEDPKYTPHPATWLNQGRWQDEPDSRPLRLVAGGYRPFRNPYDQSVYQEDLL
ncbi:MAG: helix-turn-helix domain-containing protein [Thermocrispum sp.]